jgi:hypothetical protein
VNVEPCKRFDAQDIGKRNEKTRKELYDLVQLITSSDFVLFLQIDIRPHCFASIGSTDYRLPKGSCN